MNIKKKKNGKTKALLKKKDEKKEKARRQAIEEGSLQVEALKRPERSMEPA